jgi:hypothetical protein
MPAIPFPNIPPYPGVPALVRSLNIPPVINISLGLTEALLLNSLQIETSWGIFDSKGNRLGLISGADKLNGPVLSTSAFEFSKETKISTFPLEAGSFAAYNKVELPANPTVVLALAGNASDRAAFLNLINAACLSTDLYSVVTPEVTYFNYSVERYNYARRAERGATLLLVEIVLAEIRQVSAAFSTVQTPINSPQDPAATPQQSGGLVQPAPPDQSVLKQISNAFPALGSFLSGGGN